MNPQNKRVAKAFDVRGISRTCPECEGACMIGSKLLAAHSFDIDEEPSIGVGGAFGFALLICEQCGHTRMFKADLLIG